MVAKRMDIKKNIFFFSNKENNRSVPDNINIKSLIKVGRDKKYLRI